MLYSVVNVCNNVDVYVHVLILTLVQVLLLMQVLLFGRTFAVACSPPGFHAPQVGRFSAQRFIARLARVKLYLTTK